MKKHKAARFLMVSVVLFVQVIFLLMIVKEQYKADHYVMLFTLALVTFTILLGYRYLDLHHEEYVYENVSVVIWVPLGAVACYLLKNETDFGSVTAIGIVGVVASLLPEIDKKSEYLSKLPAAIYCGGFIGMSSQNVVPSLGFATLAGILAGLFFMLSKNLFIGLGGKLGSIAFCGLVIVSLINWLL